MFTFQKLRKYIQSTWMDQRLDKLSVHGQTYRTNNNVESLNRRWNAKVITKHPNFWNLSEFIYEDLEVSLIIDTVNNQIIENSITSRTMLMTSSGLIGA